MEKDGAIDSLSSSTYNHEPSADIEILRDLFLCKDIKYYSILTRHTFLYYFLCLCKSIDLYLFVINFQH